MRMLFGHQSVGANLLDGLRELSGRGVAIPPLSDARTGALPANGPFIAHFRVGRNGVPDSKIRDFSEMVGSDLARQVDVALFKFCYVDVRDEGSAVRLFDEYAKAMDRLQDAAPGIVIGHVTVPLRTAPSGTKEVVRRLFGRGRHPEIARNAARHAFNTRLRERYGKAGTVFDLARIESGPESPPPRLLPEYTSDGGHLNEPGRVAVASGFLKFFESLRASART